MSKKDSTVTLLLNIFIPGTGHLYASGGDSWGFFAANLFCAFSGAILIFPWLALPLIWFLSIIDSSNVTNSYNKKYAKELDAQKLQNENELHDIEIKKKIDRENMVIDKAYLDGAKWAQGFSKLALLHQSDILSVEELHYENKKLLSMAIHSWTDQDVATFLGPFAELFSKKLIDEKLLKNIKNIYSEIPKQRPENLN